MNEREVAEIRRRFRAEKGNISRIRGCYVNENHEIVTQFNQLLSLMSPEEAEELLAIVKKTLSGTLGKNLLDVRFTTEQVVSSEEHARLMALRGSGLEDDARVTAFYEQMIQSLKLEGHYLILLCGDKYDVFSFSKDGEKSDESSTVFTYFLCCVCPVKVTKPALSYFACENTFHNVTANSLLGAPELGFMFPCFDDRAANIYDALFYTRNIAENHDEFIDGMFKSTLPMPAAAQKETFCSMIGETIREECNIDVVQAVQNEITGIIEEHKAHKGEEPPTVSKRIVKDVLKSCGVNDERVSAFEARYDEQFGANAEICPQNLVDSKQLEVCTENVSIKVNPERSDLVETRVIDGVKYILIRAEDGVSVNGIQIHIS